MVPSGSETEMRWKEPSVANGGLEAAVSNWLVLPLSAMADERCVRGLGEEKGGQEVEEQNSNGKGVFVLLHVLITGSPRHHMGGAVHYERFQNDVSPWIRDMMGLAPTILIKTEYLQWPG
jgi:hypothetical protein